MHDYMHDMCKERPWFSIFSFRTGFYALLINEIALIVLIVNTLKMVPEAPLLGTQQWVSSIRQALGQQMYVHPDLRNIVHIISL